MSLQEPAVVELDAAHGRQVFAERHGVAPSNVVLAPYRICPLGAHVDHQYGAVVAGALDVGITLPFRVRQDDQINLYSSVFGEEVSFSTSELSPAPQGWLSYAQGAVLALKDLTEIDFVKGIDAIVIGGGMGTGLSSSAAVGIAYLIGLAAANDLQLSEKKLIQLDAFIEQQYLGLKNGTLDPAAIVFSKDGQLTEIETRFNAVKFHEAPTKSRFFTIFSGIAQALTPANYNLRVQESWHAATLIGAHVGNESEDQLRLGDFSGEDFLRAESVLDEVSWKRARHFYSETDRVRASIGTWTRGEIDELGQLMSESASSSMDLYECGATPVKDLVSIINEVDGVAGARFCGPGFRGCCVGLLETGVELDAVVAAVDRQYSAKYPDLAEKVWARECVISDGARLV
ncbi:MAG: hypothetical protein GKR90_01840 [Pseudomonadales bacterium]|nr:hypothetical protein [Pseudomonadales bacterium]